MSRWSIEQIESFLGNAWLCNTTWNACTAAVWGLTWWREWNAKAHSVFHSVVGIWGSFKIAFFYRKEHDFLIHQRITYPSQSTAPADHTSWFGFFILRWRVSRGLSWHTDCPFSVDRTVDSCRLFATWLLRLELLPHLSSFNDSWYCQIIESWSCHHKASSRKLRIACTLR